MYPYNYEKLAEAMRRINPVDIVTANNRAQVKKEWCEKFLDEQIVNPIFTYDDEKLKKVASLKDELLAYQEAISASNDTDEKGKVINTLLTTRINESITACELAESILAGDDEKTSRLSEIIYGRPDSLSVYEATAECSGEVASRAPEFGNITKDEKEILKTMIFSASDIAKVFNLALDKIGISGWEVKVDKKYTAIDVRDKDSSGQSIIAIPEDRVVDGAKLIELIGHEIDCHLKGSENSRDAIGRLICDRPELKPMIPILAKSDNELLYEGVAKLKDSQTSGTYGKPDPFATLAIEYILSGKHDFAETAEYVYTLKLKVEALRARYSSKSHRDLVEESFDITYRIFRGSTQQSSRGYVFFKDYIYFKGFRTAQWMDSKFKDHSSLQKEEVDLISNVVDLGRPKYLRHDGTISYFKKYFLGI